MLDAGRHLQHLLNEVVTKARSKEDSTESIEAFLQAPFDASICKEYSTELVRALDATIGRIEDPSLKARLLKRVDAFR